MFKNPLLATATCLALALGSSLAQAAKPAATGPACSAGSTSVAFIDCAGSFEGNLGGALSSTQISALNSQFGDNGFHYSSSMLYSKSDATGNGVFNSDGKSFSLSFDDGYRATGLFVIGLKQATRYSFYLFDGGSTGINSLSFDVKGVVSQQTGGLSHAVYIGNALSAPGLTPAVPEPGTYALMLAGLGAVGFVAKRRARRA